MKKESILRILSLALAALLAAGILVSCDRGKKSAGAPKKVVLIVKNLTNPTWVVMKEGGQAAAAKYGVQLDVLAPLKADNNEEQISAVEQSIAKKVDVIVLIPSDSKGIIPAVEKANEAKIPVINVNTKIGEGKGRAETFIAVENYDAAVKVAGRLAELMDKKGEVIILEGKAGSQSAIDLLRGAKDTFAKFPDIKIVASQSANWSRSESLTVTQNLLQAHPNVKAIFGSNDEMALGAVEAVDQVGKTGKIMISGLDANADACHAVNEGKMVLTCNKRNFDQGYIGVETAVKFLNGEKLPEFIPIETELVDKGNVEKYLKK